MPTLHALPTLFGRLTSLQGEHAELHTLLDRIRTICQVLTGHSDSATAGESERIQVIVEWRTRLSRHFETEESPRYFGTLVTERPALIPRVAELRAEHTAVLETLELLIRLAGDPDRTLEFAARTLGLIATLERHEQAESILMREFMEGEHGAN
jgi:hypothetical protein